MKHTPFFRYLLKPGPGHGHGLGLRLGLGHGPGLGHGHGPRQGLGSKLKVLGLSHAQEMYHYLPRSCIAIKNFKKNLKKIEIIKKKSIAASNVFHLYPLKKKKENSALIICGHGFAVK